MSKTTIYKGFNITVMRGDIDLTNAYGLSSDEALAKFIRDHNTKFMTYVGIFQGLRLTGDTLESLKSKIDTRMALKGEIARMNCKRNSKLSAGDDYTDMYIENHEVNLIVKQYAGEVCYG